MGCDIHAVFQKKQESKWVDIPHNYEEERDYLLFSWLAGVRNGYGFAGVPTYTPVVPISEPRGLPEDFTVEKSGQYHPIDDWDVLPESMSKYRDMNSEKVVWMGEHSHSWLFAEEILAAPVPAPMRTGIVSKEIYDSWDRKSTPSDYCGAISGSNIVMGKTHFQVVWQTPTTELDYFVNEIKRLKEKNGEVRMVFGFDS